VKRVEELEVRLKSYVKLGCHGIAMCSWIYGSQGLPQGHLQFILFYSYVSNDNTPLAFGTIRDIPSEHDCMGMIEVSLDSLSEDREKNKAKFT
jgi:hypothetical protein